MLRDLLRRHRPARARRVSLDAEWLEPRLLYSADAAALLLAGSEPDAAETRTLGTGYEYKSAETAASPSDAEVRAAYALTPLQFEANAGQLAEGVDFAAFGSGYGIQLAGGQAEIRLAGADRPVRLELVGARPGEATGEHLLAGRSNYLVGQDASGWVTGIANYASVLYRGVYDGVDVRYYGNQGQLEYDFIVAAGADASRLQLRFDGVDHMEITAEGDLLLRVAGTGRELRFAAPVSYQDGRAGRETVASRYELQDDGSVRIVVGEYDATRELVVDPILRHATYFGDANNEAATAVAFGADGSVYVAGYTNSTAGTLSDRIGANTGGLDMFVARFNADLSSLLYATRIGGSLDDRANAIAVDQSGNAVVVGTVASRNFPMAGTVDQSALSGTRDAVVLMLNGEGDGLVFSTYFGGSGNNDAANAVSIDGSGRIHVAGTISVGNDDNAFLNIYDAEGQRLESRQFGGSGSDSGTGLAIDAAGNVYLVGQIGSSVTMVNGHQTSRGGGPDGFLVRYDVSGAINWSTYIGGTNGDSATGVAVDAGGRAYVIGRTDSPSSSGFATTSGALSTTAGNNNTGYLRIYDTNVGGAGSLAYSSFIGGTGSNNVPTAVALIGGTRVVIVGTTNSTDLPTTTDAVRRTNSTTSGFALVLDTSLSGSAQLAYGTYFANNATMGGVAVSGNTFHFAGGTAEAGLATSGAHDTTVSSTDGFIAAIGGFAYNTAPTLTGTADLPAIAEDSGAGAGALVSGLASVSDPDAGALAGIAIIAVDSANGSWQYTLDGTTWTTFTTPASGAALLLAADDSTRVRFVPAANFAGTSSITFHAWDRTTGTAGTVSVLGLTGGSSAFSSVTGTSAIAVTQVNDAPVLTGSNDLPAQLEDAAPGSGVLVSSLLAGHVADVDAGALAGIAVTAAAAGGTWEYSLDGTSWFAITTPSSGQALLLAADGSTRVRFVPDTDFVGSSSLTFHAWDRSAGTAGQVATLGTTGGSSAFSSATASASVTITAVNDAPVLTHANPLPSVREDSAAGSGVRVSDLIAGAVSDPDAGALSGIAITAAGAGGTWQYALDGTSWVSFSSPAAGQALLLAADGSTRVRFVPAPDFAGGSSITLHAWDRTTGTAGTVVALGATGGSSAFSSATASATITVTGVNDAPVPVGTPTTFLSFTESATPVSLAAAGFNYAPGGGSDEAGQAITILITRLPTNAGTLLLADGTPVELGGTYTLAELQNMQLQTRAPGDALIFTVRDSGGTADGGQDTLADQILSIAITNVAPVLSGSNGFTQLEDIPGAGTPVSEIVAGRVSDPGGAHGIAVVSVPSSGSSNGVWQYSLNGGATWLTLTGSNTNSRLLGPDARVRFVSDAGENINGNIPGFAFRAWDGTSGSNGGLANTNTNGGSTAFSTATATAALYVIPVNDVPVRFDVGTMTFLPAPANVTVNEASGFTSLGFGYLEYIPGYSEEEYFSQTLTYIVTAVPGSGVGTVYLSDGVTAVTANASYTLTQLQGMRFRPAVGAQNASGTFSWSVRDNGGTDNGGVDTLLESITISVRNVAPTLSGANAIPAIVEDVPGNGIRVSDLIAGRATDPSNLLGIAVTGANAGSAGSWQYSSDGGTTWNSLGGASSTNSILLSAGGQWRVRFNPSPNWNGTPPGFTFRAWDRSTGTPGGTADTTVNGGSTAFSSATATATLWVGAANDAPVRSDAVGVPLSPLILLDGSAMASLGLAGVTFGPGGGPDEAGQSIVSYTVTSLPTGLGTTWLADGTTQVVLGSQYTLAQIQGMQFLSYGVGALGTEAFSFAVRDNGGTDTATFSVSVIVNRAPVLHGANSPLTVFEDFDWTNNTPPGNPPPWSSPAQRAGLLVSDIVAGQIFDTAGSQGGIAVIGLAGSGTWQFTTDGGISWTTLTGVSNAAALQLAADTQTRLRFLPSSDFNSAVGTSSITFRAWDQTVGSNGTYGDATWNGGPFAYSAATATSVVTVTPRNDAPVAVGATGGTVQEGAAPAALLAAGGYAPGPATASDEAAQTLGFTFSVISDQVQILLADGATVVTPGVAYTQAQFGGMLFRSAPGASPGAWTASFVVRDSGGTADGGVDSASFSLTLTVANRAPVLLGANPLVPILEDTPDNGTLVSDLIQGQVADPTGTRGIAVTGADNSHGSWQHSRDGGTTWTLFGAPAEGSARLLLADALTRVRFVPAADWNGSAALTFAAWDGTSGTAGGVADASVGGGSSAFSTGRASSSITVLPVNDAPVGGMVADLTVAEDSGSTSLGLAAVSYGPGGGADESGQSLTFTVAALPPAALGRITLADGTGVVPGDYTIEQLRGMHFVTAADATGTGSFSFHVRDDGGGSDTLVQTVAITVTPVNDAPVAVADTLAGTEDTPLTIAAATLLANDTDIDTPHAALTITGVTSGTGGTVALVDGSIVFTPAPDYVGVAIFSYTVSDGSGGFATGIVRVELADTNDAPVANGDALSGTTGVTLVIDSATLLANDTDIDGDPLTITAVGDAVNGTVSLVDGDVVFVPTLLYVGPASFSYTVGDGRGGSSSAVVNVDLMLGNSAPVAGADWLTTPEDTPLEIAAAELLANDHDPDGGTPFITGVTAVSGGTVSLSGTTITFVPRPDFHGTARFTYTIADGNGGTATGSVNVRVTPVNDAPVANPDTFAGTEDQPLAIAAEWLTANDTDVEHHPLTVTSVTSGTGGTVVLVDGTIVFTPSADFHGAATFTYTIQDTQGSGATGTVTVLVAEVNDPPVAGADTVSGSEDEALTIAPAVLLANDSDVDGDALSIVAVGNATGGSVALVDGNVVFTPALDLNGPGSGSFTYTISDGRGGTSTAVVTVDLAPVNDPPVARDDAFTVAEDTVLTIAPATLLANDSDIENQALTVTGVTSGAGGTAAIVDGQVVFTPDLDFHGNASFSYTIEDTEGGTHSATVTVTVTPVNDAPVATGDLVNGTEDTPLVIAPEALLANDLDVDGDTLSIIGVGNATGGSVGLSGGHIVFMPAADLHGAGSGSFTYTVSDGNGGTATATVIIDLAAVNDAPLAHADLVSTDEDTPLVLTAAMLTANDEDVDGDALTVTGVSDAVGGTVVLSGSDIVFTPEAGFSGFASFRYTISDGSGGVSSAAVTVIVRPVNDAPQANDDHAGTILEDTSLTLAPQALLANDTDPEGDALAIVGVADGPGGQVNIVDGNIVFTPDPDFFGTAGFYYTVSDGNGGLSTAYVTVEVTAVNDAPVAGDDAFAGTEDTPLVLTQAQLLDNDSDVEGSALVITGVAAVSGGTVSLAGGVITFTPAENFHGQAVFTYTVEDEEGASSTGSVTIELAPVDDAPLAREDSVEAVEDQPLTIEPATLLVNDSEFDGEPLTVTGVFGAVNGSVALVDGAIVFTPDADFHGTARFSYTVSDPGGATSTAVVTVTVAEVNDAPVAVGETLAGVEDQVLSIPIADLLANDSDVDGDPLTISAVSGGAGGSVAIVGDRIVFTPDLDFHGTAGFSYTVSDGRGGTATADVIVVVAAVDDETVAAADTARTAEDNPVSGNVLANDGDVDSPLAVASFQVAGQAGTYLAGGTATIAGQGTLTIAADGSFTFTPAPDWYGSVTQVTYTTNTGASSTLDIAVDPVDDPTVTDPDTASTDEDTPVSGNVLANDSDVDDVLQVASFSIEGTTYAAGATTTLAGIGSFTLGADGAYSFTPALNWNGTVPQVTYTTNTGASSTLGITVDPVDDPTVMNPEIVTTDEDTPVSGNVLSNDSDVDDVLQVASFTISGTTYGAGATATLAGIGSFTLAADGAYSFTPLPNWNGTVPQVTYATNTGANSTLSIAVNPVDDPTVMNPEAVTTDEDTPVSGNVLANDSDVDDILQVASFSIGGTSYAAGTTATVDGIGSLTLGADGSYGFTPALNWNGAVPQVTYTTNTGASSTLDITVHPVDDATVTNPDSVSTDEDTPASGNVLANDSDVDDILQVASFTIGGTSHAAGTTVTIAGVGSFSLAADGSYGFTPAPDWNGGVPQVVYTLTTGASSTLDITVTPVDDPPVRTSPPPASLTVVEASGATPLGLAGLDYSPGGGADEAGQTLLYTVTAVPAGIGRIVLADGTTSVVAGASYSLQELRGMQFVPGPVSSGTAEFAFTVSDGTTTVPGERVTLAVVNQAPVLGGANTLPALYEDTVDAGVLVGELIAGHASDPLGRHGIAVISAESSGGLWQFSRDGGSSWNDFAAVGAHDAELLADDGLTRVRFVPDRDWNGTATGLAFRAWDQSTAPGLARADTRIHGGSTAFSTGVASATVTVLPVNDPPTAVVAGGSTVYVPGWGAFAQLDGWDYGPGGGADEATQSLTVTLTELPPGWTVTRGDGRTAVGTGEALTVQEFRDLRFMPPAGAEASTAQIAWLVRDDGGTAAGGLDEVRGSTTFVVEGPPVQDPAPGAGLPVTPPGPTASSGAGASVPATAPAAAPASLVPGRPAADPFAPVGDALMATPAAASLMEILSGFAPALLQVPQEDGHVPAAVPPLEQRGADLGSVADFLVTGFTRADGSDGRITVDEFQQALRSGAFLEELNRLRRELQEDFDLDRSTSITVAGLTLGASVAYVLWLVRGGVLLGSYLSALPAWRLLDPLPVLARAAEEEDGDEDDDEAFDPVRPGGADPLRGMH